MPWTGAFCSWCMAAPLPPVFCDPPPSCWGILSLGRLVGGGALVYVTLVGGRTVTWTQIYWSKSGALPPPERRSSLLPWPRAGLPGLSWPHSQSHLSSSSSLASPIVDVCLQNTFA